MANTIQTIQKTREYLDYVERHILNVNKAWEELNIKCRLTRIGIADGGTTYN